MVVLSETVPEDFPPDRVAEAHARLLRMFGMPIDPRVRRHVAPSAAKPEVEESLRADMRAARSPSPASRAQDSRGLRPPTHDASRSDEVRPELPRCATFVPVGGDGYWSVPS